MSLKQQIRLKIKNLLEGELSSFQFFEQRALPLTEAELPAILIYTGDEKITSLNEAPRIYKRSLQVVVEIACAHSEDVEDTIDQAVHIIELQLAQDESLGGLVDKLLLESITPKVSTDGNQIVSSQVMTFEAHYFSETAQSVPATQLNIQVRHV